MGTTDKSDKPNKDQVEATDATDAIEDAEIVEESGPEEDTADAVEDINASVDNIFEEDDLEVEEARARESEATDTAHDDDVTDEAVSEAAEEEETEPEATDAAPTAEDPVTEDASPEMQEAAATTPLVEERKSGGFVPMVLGGAVAAAIGFGGAIYFGDQLGLGGNSEAAFAEITAQFEAQNATLSELQADLSANADAASSAQGAAEAAADDLASLRAMLDDYATELGALSEAVSTFDARLSDIEKRPLNEGLGAAAIAAYEREVKDLKDLVAAQKAEAAELKDRADVSAKTALARSSVTRIVAALESGAPYRAAVVDLRSATGQEVAPILEQFADEGVIPLSALAESYPDAARAALAKARANKVDDAEGSTLGNFFKTQFGARSVEAREGTDTDAILSRAEAALRAGDLTAALGEIDTLAEGPKSVMAEWVAQAQTRADATQAAEDLAQTLNSN